jgi:hypothetical protein
VIAFFIGMVVSIVAAIPAWLMMWGGKAGATKQRLKLWAIGTGLRFAIIGGLLYYLFTQTSIAHVPTAIGVAAAYLVLYVIETILTLRT